MNMCGNLGEFLKVLLIVVTMSSIILSLRSFMNNLDIEESKKEEDNEGMHKEMT